MTNDFLIGVLAGGVVTMIFILTIESIGDFIQQTKEKMAKEIKDELKAEGLEFDNEK